MHDYDCYVAPVNVMVSAIIHRNAALYDGEILHRRVQDVLGFMSRGRRYENNDIFYPRGAMLARVIVIATCPSVRPSRAGIVSKRRKLAA